MTSRSLCTAILVHCSILAASASAEFKLVADFEDLTPGALAGQDGWYAASPLSVVIADPDNANNQVLAVTTDSTHLYHELLVANGMVRTVFLRFRFGGQQTCSFGVSDVISPDQFGHFEVELSMTNEHNELRVNDDGTYESLLTLAPDTWYNVWILIDNTADYSNIYLNAHRFTGADDTDLLDADGQTDFVFRDGAAGNLVNFFIKTGGGSSGNSGPLYLDDIYIEDTPELNLRKPTVALPDFDDDGYVSHADLAAFVICLNGPDRENPDTCPPAQFALADVDADDDVDLHDFTGFMALFSIPARAGEP